jgi:tryptophan synthase alpha chain
MSRIQQRFEQLRQAGRTGLIPFVTAGDPVPGITVDLMHAMVESGADLIELGVPFSDPMAEGPVIQQACERALRHHVSLTQVMDMVRQFRLQDDETPVVLMGYLNPIEVMGYEVFSRAATDAGVDGVLIVDLPPEESHGLVASLRENQLDLIFLVAPTSNKQRIATICASASGFIYYVSLKGVTGAAHLDVASVADKLKEIRTTTDLPIGVGFGIKDAETAARVAEVSDAVVVGSAIVKLVGANENNPEQIKTQVTGLLRDMRHAMDQVQARAAGA